MAELMDYALHLSLAIRERFARSKKRLFAGDLVLVIPNGNVSQPIRIELASPRGKKRVTSSGHQQKLLAEVQAAFREAEKGWPSEAPFHYAGAAFDCSGGFLFLAHDSHEVSPEEQPLILDALMRPHGKTVDASSPRPIRSWREERNVQ